MIFLFLENIKDKEVKNSIKSKKMRKDRKILKKMKKKLAKRKKLWYDIQRSCQKGNGKCLEKRGENCFWTECEVEIKKCKKTLDKKGKESIIITRDCQEVTKRRAQY